MCISPGKLAVFVFLRFEGGIQCTFCVIVFVREGKYNLLRFLWFKLSLGGGGWRVLVGKQHVYKTELLSQSISAGWMFTFGAPRRSAVLGVI